MFKEVAMDFPQGRSGHGVRILKVNGVTQSNDQYNTSLNWVNSANGTENPAWRVQVKGHTSATTAFTGIRHNFHYGNGIGHVKWNVIRKSDGVLFQQGDLVGEGFRFLPSTLLSLASDPASLDSANAISAAKMRLLSAIRDTYRQFQGGVFFGELLETIHQIRHPAEALQRGLKTYKRDVQKRLAKYVPGALTAATRKQLNTKHRNIANRIVKDTWLEYVFGWKPLINDIKDGARALAYKDYRIFIPVSGSGKSSSASNFTVIGNNTINGMPIDLGYTVRGTVNCWLKGECGTDAAQRSVLNINRFGLNFWSEVAPTIWELIPYSFLVDYFSNIGQMIDGMSTQLSGVRWVCGIVKREVEVTLNYSRFNQGLLTGIYNTEDASFKTFLTEQTYSYSGYTNTFSRVDRSAWTIEDISLSLGDFRFRVPGVGSTRWLNIAALFGRKR